MRWHLLTGARPTLNEHPLSMVNNMVPAPNLSARDARPSVEVEPGIEGQRRLAG